MNQLQKTYISILDDDSKHAIEFSKAFETFDPPCELLHFTEGRELFNFLAGKSKQTILIILSKNLIYNSSTDIIKLLKRNPEYSNIPVIFYNSADSANNDNYLNLGAEAILKVPLSEQETKKALNVLNKYLRE